MADRLMEEYLRYKRSLGYELKSAEFHLRSFASFVHPESMETALTKDNVNDFLVKERRTYKSVYGQCSALREFGLHMVSMGYGNAYVVPKKMATLPAPEPPYFFSKDEIETFFQSADAIRPNNNYKGREILLPAIFRILYCCGLRCIEAVRLKRSDMHLGEGYFDILGSKIHTSRRIHMGSELAGYMAGYDARMDSIVPFREHFFSFHKERMISEEVISTNFKKIWRTAFPSFPHDFTRPRPYDLRHHFVWRNINSWVRDGVDVNVMLPYLMRYMGHASIRSTMYYFHFVPDFHRDYLDIVKESESIIPEVEDHETNV